METSTIDVVNLRKFIRSYNFNSFKLHKGAETCRVEDVRLF